MSATDHSIDAATRSRVIDGALDKLRAHYVHPPVAREIDAYVRQQLDAGAYDDITTAEALRDTLTAHLQAAGRDKHLVLRYSAEPRPLGDSDNVFDDPAVLERMRLFDVVQNYGFERVERLRGNVGYLDLRGFAPPEWSGCGDTASAAMTLLANTSALIIDLRNNGGGSGGMVDLLCSYLLPAVPERTVHLIDFNYEDRIEQHRTLPYVPGPRYEDKPVYILTSGRTISAPEAFAYVLQGMGRATIVGETTAGAANLVGQYQIDALFSVFVSNGRVVVPCTGGDWEGTGVQPDLVVSQEDALKTAHVAALEKLREAIGATPTGLDVVLLKEVQAAFAAVQG